MKNNEFYRSMILLETALRETYEAGAQKSGDPGKPDNAILPEHFEGFLDFRRNMHAVLASTHGTAGEGIISAGYVLSQVISMRECHDMEPADTSHYSNATLSIAYELAAKDRLVDSDGTPRSIWDDLDNLSNASKEALSAVVICNLRACKTSFTEEQCPGMDLNGNPRNFLEAAHSYIEGATTFIERMPDHQSLKTMPLLKYEKASLLATYSAVMHAKKGLEPETHRHNANVGRGIP